MKPTEAVVRVRGPAGAIDDNSASVPIYETHADTGQMEVSDYGVGRKEDPTDQGVATIGGTDSGQMELDLRERKEERMDQAAVSPGGTSSAGGNSFSESRCPGHGEPGGGWCESADERGLYAANRWGDPGANPGAAVEVRGRDTGVQMTKSNKRGRRELNGGVFGGKRAHGRWHKGGSRWSVCGEHVERAIHDGQFRHPFTIERGFHRQ